MSSHQLVKNTHTGETTVALTRVCLNLFTSRVAKLDAVSAVDLFANNQDFFFDRQVEVIEELEVRGRFAALNDCFCKCNGTFATLCPVITDNSCICTCSKCLVTNKGKLSR